MRATGIDQQDIQRVRTCRREAVQEYLKLGHAQGWQAQEIRGTRARGNRAVQVNVAVGVLLDAAWLRATCRTAPAPNGLEAQPAFVHRPDLDRLGATLRQTGVQLISERITEGRDGRSRFVDATAAAL